MSNEIVPYENNSNKLLRNHKEFMMENFLSELKENLKQSSMSINASREINPPETHERSKSVEKPLWDCSKSKSPRNSLKEDKKPLKEKEYSGSDFIFLLILIGVLYLAIEFWPYTSPLLFLLVWFFWSIYKDALKEEKRKNISYPSSTKSIPKIKDNGISDKYLPAGKRDPS